MVPRETTSSSPPQAAIKKGRNCSMSTSITNCCMTKRYQIIMDQSACMACLRRGQGRQSTCVCRREFRMNSRRRGSPPQCAGNLARKNSLSIIVNTFAKLLLNPLFHIIWASWPRLLQFKSVRIFPVKTCFALSLGFILCIYSS